jgi:hypothetical protein
MSIEHTDIGALRRSVILLAAASIVGLAAELVVERHWGTPVRFIPWIALVGLAWSVWRLWRGPSARDLRNARVIAGVSCAAAVLGIFFHVNENYRTGPLDEEYSLLWGAMSEAERWWAAFNKSLGPAPTFAPAALILVSLLVVIATQRYPALAR